MGNGNADDEPGANRTKVGLKRVVLGRTIFTCPSANRTKVGLKPVAPAKMSDPRIVLIEPRWD